MPEAICGESAHRLTARKACREALPKLYAACFTMQFDHRTRVNPYHAPSLAGYLKTLLGGNLPPELWFHASDDGVTRFEKGDEYSFVVYSLPGGLAALQRLIQGAFTRTAQELDGRAFGPRWHCKRVSDGFRKENRIAAAHELSALTFEEIDAEARLWSVQDEVYLRLLGPLQLLKPKDSRPKKGLGRFCRDGSEIDGPLLLERLRQSIDGLRRRLGFENPLPAPEASLEFIDSDLFWHGTEQTDRQGGQKPVYGLGGISWLRIRGEDGRTVWLWLILGQYLGIGQRRGFGLGRYRLEGTSGERSGRLPERSASLLRSAFETSNLDMAWRAIRDNKRKSAFDRELEAALSTLPNDADQHTALSDHSKRILSGSYETPNLKGVVIEKPSGGRRALAIPPLLDRVLQRAVAQALNEVIEPILYAHSFGYRPGRSRRQARDLIQRLVREGHGWFFESDIDNFFDAVDPVLVYNRLMSLLPDDPAIDQIMQWAAAPVRYDGRLIVRGGLPQGSPLSPLLANLVLDDFDNDLRAAGFSPVRFADDFVVPCTSRADAERARDVVSASLQEKGLELNADQSRVARFSDGLKFLGYRFLNDLAIETRKSPRSKTPQDPSNSDGWWAHSSATEPQETGDAPVAHEPKHEAAADDATGEAVHTGTVVIISEPGCALFTREGQLWSQHEDRPARMIAPWPQIGALLMIGYQRITQAALLRAMEHRVPVHFTDAFGRLKGRLIGEADDNERALWLTQLETCKDENYVVTVARELVASRLHHQSQVLRRRGVGQRTLRRFKNKEETAIEASSLESLRGIEGSATREYFQSLAALLPDWPAFNGRNRRPPRDPFNALLSLGYTLLYTHTETLIRMAGLLPDHGFYHQPRGRHAALASDMMEPFRHLVESTALAQINRRRLCESDFLQNDEGACRIGHQGRKAYLMSLARRLSGAMTNANGTSMSGHEHIYQQAVRLSGSLSNRKQAFEATRLK
ncbi:CRISPR-associated endonuclease Cas1 [Wenzhouxiangella sp. XN79A]|uniref:CRISPR-associated endonuclease Cas1 n=1 Tax=Wenzhouxiangella sp. XN79A TaxID=2724193 RepID=UPI00144AD012|nr:CRISPR-associated endonuclease Cas1 [Wenzhouxiangella sp. XN79A]NKI33912.1 CRISPR-associated endonuclease Cas1 [Wenzhouxiangella sp. XN79A]